jgi:carbonic anhydrase
MGHASGKTTLRHHGANKMDRRYFLKGLAGLALCPVCAKVGAAEGVHWGYEGEHGPDHWGDLDAASRVCSAGSQQSPLDITGAVMASLPPVRTAWAKRTDTIVNNGHTIQVNVAEGSNLTVGDARYSLVQFHFHRPSEHLIGGKNFPMEAHFVHRNAAGGLGVIGVMMALGRANKAFAKIVATMPAQEGPPVKADPAIDPNGLLPARRSYYRYEGSLTTPPCSETVAWMLLKTPIEVAQADIDKFAKLYPMNARPAQKVDRRFVLRSA